MKNRVGIVIIFLLIIVNSNLYCQVDKNQNQWLQKSTSDFVLHYTTADSALSNNLFVNLIDASNKVIHYFGKPCNKFDVYLFPSRKKLDEQWSKDWGVPGFKSECWMVASGVAHRLDILSPRVWETEACEHDAENQIHIQEIVVHELTHVFHGQQNPNPDFAGMDDIGWFVEGIAVLTAGQLNAEKIKQLKEAYESNKLPANLESGWSGKYRYSVSGSMVKFIEEKWGKEKLITLLKFTNEKEILNELNISEDKFLEEWKNWLNSFF